MVLISAATSAAFFLAACLAASSASVAAETANGETLMTSATTIPNNFITFPLLVLARLRLSNTNTEPALAGQLWLDAEIATFPR